jgi:hypothetical protein
MIKRFLRVTGFLVVDFLIALHLLQAYFGWYLGLLYVDRGSEHPVWLNITPGCSDTIPDLFLTHYSPWVLPREQNFSSVVGVSIRPGRPVVLKGKPNQARYCQAPAPQPPTFFFHSSQGPDAVPLDLEEILRIIEGPCRRGQHG